MTEEKKSDFRLKGSLQLETLKSVPEDLALTAYAFDTARNLLGSAAVDKDGNFNVVVKLRKAEDVELVIAPEAEPKLARESAAYNKWYLASDWQAKDRSYRIHPDVFIRKVIWWPWWPSRICVSGHVRKVKRTDGTTTYCPVPFVKVEVFDVDREGCWWPYLTRARPELLDRRAIRIPELIKEVPDFPPRPPEPDPIGPIARLRRPCALPVADIGPQPDPPTIGDLEADFINPRPESSGGTISAAAGVANLGPQPEPPDHPEWLAFLASTESHQAFRSGKTRALDGQVAARFDQLTLTSRVAPWVKWRGCFYSKAEVCETFTDCNGYFRCCFSWWPWHFRRGRLRFDRRPDIILRVTQIIDSVEKVIYLDPYTSTRWNTTNAHIDLFLDDEDIVCGTGCGPDAELADSQATLLQIGRDEVWDINQANGKYEIPGTTNGAFGRSLLIRGDFSTNLKDGTSKRYYRMSYAEATAAGTAPADSAFVPIMRPLEVLRAPFMGAFDTYILGPQTVGTEGGLYEVQDILHWWMMPWSSIPYLTVGGGTILGVWPTRLFENDHGTYFLRMEVFDQTGTKMPAVQFPNHGGNSSGDDPDPPPIMTGHLDIKVHIDNKPIIYDLVTPAPDECGIIPWSPGLALDFTVEAAQVNGRVHNWSLHYVRGTVSDEHSLGSNVYPNGILSVNENVSGAGMLADPSTPSGLLEKSCAFALILRARSHVRVNHGWHRYANKEYAIAIEKCMPCPATKEKML